eukprot:TRINITY_DN3593_c0_g1_i9.p1 TRINITY_DN3593_c0_g1~~TRINITY_DN3593_c0_g1_i9.p1  ORF type:complete len:438 (+),score=59.48 TRINITY_DN3593_c0_g1_i9:181-1314(+)
MSHHLSPTNEQTKALFELGVKLYHVFWFDLSRAAFKNARLADPNCTLAYWGEALTYKFPIWHTEYPENATRVLNLIPENIPTSDVERELINAVRVYLDPSKSTFLREYLYAEAMKVLYEQDLDEDINALYALSLLGLATNQNQTDALSQCRAVLPKLLNRCPNHRGLLHYWTHLNDNPLLANQAVNESTLLAKLSPASTHSVHMQSHIFLDLGKWDKVVISNDLSLSASDRFCNAIGQGDECDEENRYHALEWSHYGHLQLRDKKICTDRFLRLTNVWRDELKLEAKLNYAQWLYRIYSRQQVLQPDTDLLKFLYPDEDHVLPPSITYPSSSGPDQDNFWQVYSESGALVARTSYLPCFVVRVRTIHPYYSKHRSPL